MTLNSKLDALKKILPKPQSYRVLIAMPPQKQTTAAGLYVTKEQQEREHTATILGNVISLGVDAYKDQSKFPNGPSCKEGDWIMFRPYVGLRFMLEGQEFRLIHDDTVEAVVPNPTLIGRVGALTAPDTGKAPAQEKK